MSMDVSERIPPVILLDELKAWLRIEDTLEDAVLAMELRAATEAIETYLGYRLLEREVVERGVLAGGRMRLSAAPAQRLIGAWTEEDGNEVPLENGRLENDRSAACVIFPAAPSRAKVGIRYVAGQTADWNALSTQLRIAVIRVAAHMHASRDGEGGVAIPEPVQRSLALLRRRRVV